jgi:hypothetical protein
MARDLAPIGRDERWSKETISGKLRADALREESFTMNRVPAIPAETPPSTETR